MDPRFNLRELTKQLLLVEDHLQHPRKFCPDCLRKHLLTCEALAEEAVTLGAGKSLSLCCELLAERCRRWLIDLTDQKDPQEIAQTIRALRKKLVPFVYDPRVLRTASISDVCPHRLPSRF